MIKSPHIIVLALLLFSACGSHKPRKHIFQKELMYTVFDIVVYSSSPKFQLQKDIDFIWEQIKELEYQLSPTKDGFLGQLNQQKKISCSENPEIFGVISNFIVQSQNINQLSDGAFDLTVYPLIRLWGFYLQDETYRVPSKAEISNTLTTVGMSNIIITNNQIILQNNVQLGFGAIAKGYAVDIAIELLKQNTNITAGFVNAGGNIKVYGTKPDNTLWQIAIRNPNGGELVEYISLNDGDAIATSGDYEQYFQAEDGTYYHHIFDPKTGSPVTHKLASVSVVLNGSAELTDILATTFLVMGVPKSEQLIKKLDPKNEYSIFFIERNQADLTSFGNQNWNKRRVLEVE